MNQQPENPGLTLAPDTSKPCPECNSTGTLSVRAGRLRCSACVAAVEDQLGWLEAALGVMIEDADGDVRILAAIADMIGHFEGYADVHDPTLPPFEVRQARMEQVTGAMRPGETLAEFAARPNA